MLEPTVLCGSSTFFWSIRIALLTATIWFLDCVHNLLWKEHRCSPITLLWLNPFDDIRSPFLVIFTTTDNVVFLVIMRFPSREETEFSHWSTFTTT